MGDDHPNSPPEASGDFVKRHRRRPRYSGTHPRRFQEKYKELNPAKFPETVQKVLSSGKTPAGMHRPICVAEIMDFLNPQPGQIAVDATLGFGGHARELLHRLMPGGRLIGLDTDPLELPKTEARLRAEGFGIDRFVACNTNFAGLPRVLAELGMAGVDLVLADLGCSSMQFDNPERGFSYKLAGPLDLRMNPRKGQSAADLLRRISEDRLGRILRENADESEAARIAAAITQTRARGPVLTTTDLTVVVRTALASLAKYRDKEALDACLKRVFQALRIEVNDEFGALETFLRFLPACLKPGGRVAVLTFHSGEDRRVKRWFQEGLRQGLYESVAEEVIRPSPQEIFANPRASSAKLRWAIRALA